MRLRFRYSLKVFLLIWLVIGLGLGWFGIHWQKAKKQAAAMQAMTTGSASYEYEREHYDPMYMGRSYDAENLEYLGWNYQQPKVDYSQLRNTTPAPPVPPEPAWLIRGLGVDFFHPVTSYLYPAMKGGCGWEEPQLTEGLGKEMDRLAALPLLRELYLYPDEIDVPQVMESSLFTNLGKLRELEELWLAGMPLKAEHLAPLRGHPKLRKLTLNSEEITDETLAALSSLPALEELILNRCTAVGKSGLPAIANWRKLHTVEVAYTSIDDRILISLSKLPELKALNLAQTKISMKTLRELRKLRGLKRLSLSGLPFTDAQLAEVFQGWSGLETLDLSNTLAGEQFAGECEKFSGLKFLNLSATSITHEGLEKISEQLAECKVVPDLSVQFLGGRASGPGFGGRSFEGGLGGGMGGGFGGGMGGDSEGGMGGGRGAFHAADDDSETSDQTLDPTSASGGGVF